MVVTALTFIAVLDLFVLAQATGREQLAGMAAWLFFAGMVISLAFEVGRRLMKVHEDRQDRRFNVEAGLPVRRRLWHPAVIAALWFVGMVGGLWLIAHVGIWLLERRYGREELSAAESQRVADQVTAVLYVLVALWMVGVVVHVLVQIYRRRRDDRRVLEEGRALLPENVTLPPLPPLWLPNALTGIDVRWRWALRDPLGSDDELPGLRSASKGVRYGLLALMALLVTAVLALWVMAVGFTSTHEVLPARLLTGVVWLFVPAAVLGVLGPDLVRPARAVIRAALLRGSTDEPA